MPTRLLVLALASIAIVTLFFVSTDTKSNADPAEAGLSVSDVLIPSQTADFLRAGKPFTRSKATRLVAPYNARLRDAYTVAADPDLLVLREGVVDPKDGFGVLFKSMSLKPKQLPEAARLELETLSTSRIQVVQFSYPIDRDTAVSLREAGMDVVGYLPNNAFLVRVPATKDNALAGQPGVRWSGELPPAYKLSPNIRQALEQGVTADSVFVQVAAYSGEPVARWQRLAETLGAELIFAREDGGTPRVMLRVPADALADIATGFAALPGVENLRIFDVPTLLNHGSIWLLQSGDPELKSTPLFDVGLTGWGQIYAAVDSGLDTDGCQFRYDDSSAAQTMAVKMPSPRYEISDPDNKVIAYYVMTGSDAYDESSGGYHGTQTTGCAVGDNYATLATRDDPGIDYADGMAPAAQVVFQDAGTKTGYLYGLAFESQYQINEQAYKSGARVHNDSYGLSDTSVHYDADSQQLDDFAWQANDYTIFFAAGNSGPGERTLGGEGSTAKNTVCVGASMPGWYENGQDMIYFSSRGPTSDGRLKPDIVAPGLIESATESSGRRLDGKVNVYGQPAVESSTDPPNNQCAVAMTGGTSFASPTAAGMGILARQYFTDGYYPTGARNEADGWEPSSALIRAVMINSARNMTGDVVSLRGSGQPSSLGKIDAAPSTMQGWGMITLDDALYLRGDRRDLEVFADIPNGGDGTLTTGDEVSYDIYVKSTMDFKVSLAWIDPNGSLGAGRLLVNDLDLEVVSPNGDRYYGNVNVENGTSSPIGDESVTDTLNPQEQVIVAQPQSGTWTIIVRGADVPGNGRFYPHESNEQGYALIATGDLGEGPDDLFPRITSQYDSADGGCDNDASLDANEVITLRLNVLNTGDGDSGPLYAVVETIADDSSIDTSHVILPDDGITGIDPIKSKELATVGVKVGLDNIEDDICDGALVLEVSIYTADDEFLDRTRITVPIGIDYVDDGTVICQRMQCSPPAEITEIQPPKVVPGQNGFSIEILGHYFKEGISLRFEPDVISYDELEYNGPTELRLKRVEVATDAEVGPVTVFVTNPDELEMAYSDLLEVFIPDDVSDGDVAVDGDDTPDNPGQPVTSSGCNGIPATSGWLLLMALGLFVLRRRERA